MELLALSGGGSNGAWQAGVTYSLWKKGYRPDVVAGTSVGALNAIMVATGQIDKMGRIWNQMSDTRVRKKRSNFRLLSNHLIHKIGIRDSIMAKWSNDPLKDLLREVLYGMTTLIPCYVSAVEIRDGHPDQYISTKIPPGTIFNEDNIDAYVDIIVRSTAIPIVFEPVRKGNRLYFDGGLHHSTPIYEAIRKQNIESMTAVCCNPIRSNADTPKDIIEIAKWTLNTLLAYRFYRDWLEFKKWNQVAQQGDIIIDGEKVKYISDTVYFPDTDLGDPLDFSKEKAQTLFNKGVIDETSSQHTAGI